VVIVNQLHATLANTVILFMVVCGLWGFFAAFRGGMNGSLSGALVIGEGLIIVQGLLGGISYLLGNRPAQSLHFLYGLSTLITLPGIYSFTRGRSSESRALWFGAGALFIAGLAIRGITTARGLGN
jgi:heme A synthase